MTLISPIKGDRSYKALTTLCSPSQDSGTESCPVLSSHARPRERLEVGPPPRQKAFPGLVPAWDPRALSSRGGGEVCSWRGPQESRPPSSYWPEQKVLRFEPTAKKVTSDLGFQTSHRLFQAVEPLTNALGACLEP